MKVAAMLISTLINAGSTGEVPNKITYENIDNYIVVHQTAGPDLASISPARHAPNTAQWASQKLFRLRPISAPIPDDTASMPPSATTRSLPPTL